MWNVFDTSFVVVFFVYLGLRLMGLYYGDSAFCLVRYITTLTTDNALVQMSETAFDILAIDACILFPRYALINMPPCTTHYETAAGWLSSRCQTT